MDKIESFFKIMHPSAVAEEQTKSLSNAKEIVHRQLGSEKTDLNNPARRSDYT
jgi:hypothetical protein